MKDICIPQNVNAKWDYIAWYRNFHFKYTTTPEWICKGQVYIFLASVQVTVDCISLRPAAGDPRFKQAQLQDPDGPNITSPLT